MRQDTEINEQMGVNLITVLRTIWNIRYRLLKGAVIGAVLGLIIGFSIPKEYAVTVTLTPETASMKSGGGLANMAASFLGGGFSQASPDAVNALLAPEIVKSTPFLLEMLDARIVNPSKRIDTTLGTYLENLKSPWWGVIPRLPGKIICGIKSVFEHQEEKSGMSSSDSSNIINLSKEQMSQLNILKFRVNALIDKQNSLISLHVNMQDPVITALVVDSVVNKLQKYLINYKISKANDDYKYWEKIYQDSKNKYYQSQQAYAHYVDMHSDIIFQRTLVEKERLQNEMNFDYQTFTQVAQQMQMAQSKVQEAKPSFTVVEPAVVPDTPIGMSKMVRMILYSVIIMLLLVFWELFLRDFFLDFKTAFKQA